MAIRGAAIGALVGAALACRATPVPPAVPVRVPVPPRVPTSYVELGELADPAAIGRIEHRALIAGVGRVWTRLDDDTTLLTTTRELFSRPRQVLVIGEVSDRIRIVSYAESAWIALWIERASAVPVIIRTVRLDPDAAVLASPAPATDVGVWLAPGAIVAAGRRIADRIEVAPSDPHQPYPVRASGWIAADVLGEIWSEPAAPLPTPRPPSISVDTFHEVSAGTIRAAPAVDAMPIAELVELHEAETARSDGAWVEVELRARELRVHGFVPRAAVKTIQAVRDHSPASADFTLEPGYGISGPTVREVRLLPGTCLHAGPGGEPIGVQTSGMHRSAFAAEGRPGWWEFNLVTDWGLVEVAVHEAAGSAPGPGERWEGCPTKPR